MGYPRIRPFGRDLSFLSFFFLFILSHTSPHIIVVIDLTTISHSNVFANKDHVASKLNLVNIPGLNYLLRSEIFASEDGQLRAAHLILDYEPLSRIFQDVSQTLRAINPKLARIDNSKPGFLARRDLSPIVLQVNILSIPWFFTIVEKPHLKNK